MSTLFANSGPANVIWRGMNGLPAYSLEIRTREGKKWLWDPVRKKEVILQPEEYVRQCLIRFLNDEKKYPLGLMAVERKVKFNHQDLRFDLAVYDNSGNVLLLAECKSPDISIRQEASMQIARYNRVLKSKMIVFSNGPEVRIFRLNSEGVFSEVEEIPVYTQG